MPINSETSKISKNKTSFSGFLKRWFLAGLLVSAPILLTLYITWLLVNLIDGYATALLPSILTSKLCIISTSWNWYNYW